MSLFIHAMINQDFRGDTENVLAIAKQFPESTVHTYQDLAVNAVEQVLQNLNTDNANVVLLSGTHGIEFLNHALKNEKFYSLLKENKLIISWSGHQAPKELKIHAENIKVVGLIQESIDEELQAIFGDRLVATKMVPNTLNEQILSTALTNWNTKNPQLAIPLSTNGYLCVIMAGDAPDEDGRYKYYSPEEAYQQAKAFALNAKHLNKILLVTNGPRTGAFYPESPDQKKPVLRRYNEAGEWLSITTAEDKFPRSHSPRAPLDPVSQAFLKGIQDSELPAMQFKFIDFVFGNSAYQSIVAAAFSQANQSYFFYARESISNAEIGCFIPMTYSYDVGSMSNRHKQISDRFANELHIIGLAKIEGTSLQLTSINQSAKQITLNKSQSADAALIAARIRLELEQMPRERPKMSGPAI